MLFDHRTFALAKDPEHPQEYQDASGLDAARGIATIADGVSSALFSGPWAAVLAEAIVADPPNLSDGAAFARWLHDRRAAWAARIDTSSLAWFQRAKLPTGAFSTLLWLYVLPVQDEQQQAGAFGGFRLVGHAIGDSCLFHVRGGELVRSFPIQTSAELQADPLVLGSVDLGRDGLIQFATLDQFCYPDDLIVLCTDALAEWALRRYEAGEPPNWDAYWDTCREDWQAEIISLREGRQMRYDDTTLVMLRVAPQTARTIVVDDDHLPDAVTVPVGEASGDDGLDSVRTAARDIKSVSERMAEHAGQTSEKLLRSLKSLRDRFKKK